MFKDKIRKDLEEIHADEHLLAATRQKITSAQTIHAKSPHAAGSKRKRILSLSAAVLCSVLVISSVAVYFSQKGDEGNHFNLFANLTHESTQTSDGDSPDNQSDEYFEDSDITTYDSYASIKTVLSKASLSDLNYSADYDGLIIDDADTATSNSEGTAESSDPTTTDYSATNTQVEGVDEADIIKNDGEYIYYVSCGILFVLDVRDPENILIVAKLSEYGLDADSTYSNISDIFYDEDTKTLSLIYFAYMYYLCDDCVLPETATGSIRGNDKLNNSDDYYPDNRYTLLRVYDVSDPASPKLTRSFAQEGSYLSSRRMGDTVYLVSSTYMWYDLSLSGDEMVPAISSDGSSWAPAPAESIHFVDETSATSYSVVSAINTTDMSKDPQTEVVAGTGNIVYCSNSTLYVVAEIWDAEIDYETIPQLYTASEDIATSTDIAASTDSATSEDSATSTDVVTSEENAPSSDSYYKTKILSFDITDGNLSAKAAGTVDGYIINQYALDEYDGFLRIATTTGDYSGNTENNIFVLDESLDQISSLTDLAPGESIYSVRFYGETIYMVTFVEVDPLFVIDASDPYHLSVLGELKIPGYSNYMQLIGDNLLLAIGNETYTDSGSVIPAGLKIAVFDVSDPENPVLVSSLVYGDSYGSSSVSYNPKNLLINMNRGLIGLPVSFDKISKNNEYEYEEGFLLLHIDSAGNLTQECLFNELCYEYSEYRGVYIGDTLFVLCDSEIASYSLLDYSQLDSEILA